VLVAASYWLTTRVLAPRREIPPAFDTARVPTLLAAEGIHLQVASAFGTEQLPTGLRVLVRRRAA
jgi:hypothetical protein